MWRHLHVCAAARGTKITCVDSVVSGHSIKWQTSARYLCVDNCYVIGLRSLKGHCHGNQFFCWIHTFISSQQCAINCVHSATTRSTVAKVIREFDHRLGLLTTPIHRGKDISLLGTDILLWAFPLGTFPRHWPATGCDKKCKCCAGRRRTNYLTS